MVGKDNPRPPDNKDEAPIDSKDSADDHIQGIAKRLTHLEGQNKQAREDQTAHARKQDNLIDKMLKIQSARPSAADPRTELMNSITLIAGFLVIAAFPTLTQDLSGNSDYRPTHFSPNSVRVFAAVSVGLFLTVIMLCQGAKLMLVARGSGPDGLKSKDPVERQAPQHSNSTLSAIFPWVLIELLTLAILFLLLIVAAYVWVPGLVFVVLDGLFALTCLALILVGSVGAVEELKASS